MAQHTAINPALNLTHGEPQVFKTMHSETNHRDHRFRVIDIALATSAAPVFFPIVELDNHLFADGGLFAKAPDSAALHKAENFLNIDPSAVRMLSVGTTTSKYAIGHSRYIRVDSEPAAEVLATLGLDRGDSVSHITLRGLASRDASTKLSMAQVRGILAHVPRQWIIRAV
jgi:uncharacterized protein